MVARMIRALLGLGFQPSEREMAPARAPEEALPRPIITGQRDDALPADVVGFVTSASVFYRPDPMRPDEDAAIMKIEGVGQFYWDGVADTAERLGRAFPELSPTQRRKAARLAHAQLGKRNRSPRVMERPSWVWDW